jgi:predicted phosphate transport protein (TIGR00153 family)
LPIFQGDNLIDYSGSVKPIFKGDTMFSDKKAMEVETLMIQHVKDVGSTITETHKMFRDYLASDKAFKQESYQVHKMEQKADLTRSEIGLRLYEGAFLPIYRTDYYDIVDRTDRIANSAELFCDFLVLTRPLFPDFIVKSVDDLLEKNDTIYNALALFFKSFIDGDDKLLEYKQRVELIEKEIDAIQFKSTRLIFKSDLPKIEKFHIKWSIDKFCRMSDLMEDLTDRIEILAAKIKM